MIFKLPDVGEGLSEAEIVEWYVTEGDSIKAGDPMLSIETDKAIVDIPSPATGKLTKLLVEVGDIVATGKPLVQLDTQADAKTAHQETQSETGSESVRESESVSVVGEIHSSQERITENASRVEVSHSSETKVMPAVRAFAMKNNVDLSLVTPTGRDGTITKADVERVAKRLDRFGPAEKIRGTRRAMAMTMTRSHSEVAPATLMDEVNVHHWPEGTDVTGRLLRAVVAGCQTEPALNAWFDGHAMTRRLFDKIDVALAMDTKDGLFTPVLRDVAALPDAGIREAIEHFKTAVHERTISRDLLRDFTITLSNYGTLAGRFAVAVVVPPTVAIVGAGRIYQGITVVDQKAEVRQLLPLSLTFDHRAVTGGEAGRFLEAMKTTLSEPNQDN